VNVSAIIVKSTRRELNGESFSNCPGTFLFCGLSLHRGSRESRKTPEQKLIFQIATLTPHVINERFSFNQ